MVEAAELARLRQGRAFAGQATGSEFFFFPAEPNEVFESGGDTCEVSDES